MTIRIAGIVIAYEADDYIHGMDEFLKYRREKANLNGRKIVVTGGAGFIGSAVVRTLLAHGAEVINLDKLTYAGNLESLDSAASNPRHSFFKLDICDRDGVTQLLNSQKPDAIIHLAAESHVDRSIDGPAAFVQTNIVGTSVLLETALEYWRGLDPVRRSDFRFHHVSTDEVYGSLESEELFSEESRYAPNSPYAASKASSDHLVRAWHHTYGFPSYHQLLQQRYGPGQFPKAHITTIVASGWRRFRCMAGENIRDWLYVEDHACALVAVFQHGCIAKRANIRQHRNVVIRTL